VVRERESQWRDFLFLFECAARCASLAKSIRGSAPSRCRLSDELRRKWNRSRQTIARHVAPTCPTLSHVQRHVASPEKAKALNAESGHDSGEVVAIFG
jgi:hypothetical protein